MKRIDEYMRIKEAAAFVGVTPNTLRNWEREQKLQAYRNPQNQYRLYDKDDLENLLKNIKPRSVL